MRWVLALLLMMPILVSAQTQFGVGVSESGFEVVNAVWNERELEMWLPRLDLQYAYLPGPRDYRQHYEVIGISGQKNWESWDFAFGVVELDHETDRLTSKYQFMTTVEFHLTDQLSLALRHISNGNTGGSNLGENFFFLTGTFP